MTGDTKQYTIWLHAENTSDLYAMEICKQHPHEYVIRVKCSYCRIKTTVVLRAGDPLVAVDEELGKCSSNRCKGQVERKDQSLSISGLICLPSSKCQVSEAARALRFTIVGLHVYSCRPQGPFEVVGQGIVFDIGNEFTTQVKGMPRKIKVSLEIVDALRRDTMLSFQQEIW